ncbi:MULTISPECIES: glycosyltransferase family 2 protein [Bacteroides]|jgi:glycosyltransferase involved in cell wall biosynthesis|uniref:glycosyltransferase family 2 protein n=1 Tax=Bacteroides TaxID=816 RepID=UPI0006ACEB74|nr:MULTISPECIES: glycosyltransferase family 2 protein [Bacteroides]MCM0364789.1 glycosyltransferase family 2 protein [Bacteroides fragilis]MCZ2670736.1 glycosyltransferase family 2 protein [Bacteroides fragilis]MDA1490956.1 glycosyltransferase family 2 protein [Bacteroides fragilis]MDV6204554.1 glycosyltransferase family 2 protein [Bacteroides hominis (ex Liu et al. 2022)]QCQ56020.1 glycosyltransferase family 2 protein [Bacteroides fragilis]
MNSIMVSIIIPVYNVEKCIGKCLESVFTQSYTNIECVIVNDATPDHSMSIINDLLSLYSGDIKFKIIVHEYNKGLSAARNTGVTNATGDYVFFLDSDDELPERSIESFIRCLDKYGNVDFLIGNFDVIGDFYYKLLHSEILLRSNDEILRRYISGDLYVMAWGKLINRSFFTEKGIWFIEGILHEDEYFSFCLAMKSNTVVMIEDIVYRYIIRRNDSITASKSKRNYWDYLKVIEMKIQLAQEMKVSIKGMYSYLMSILYGFVTYMFENNCLSMRDKRTMLKQIRCLKKDIKLNDRNLSMRDCIKGMIIKYSWTILCIVANVRKVKSRMNVLK